jgi:hypothetical protein
MMDKVDLEKWQVIEDEFLNSDLDEAAFCKSRKLNLAWFNFVLNTSLYNILERMSH